MEKLSIMSISRNYFVKIITVLFVILTLWWITIFYRGLTASVENNAFTLIYPLLSLSGGIAGLLVSKKWSGRKSLIGRAILCFSVGLLLQFFGQAAYAYYIYIQGITVPYPSIGDIGYMGSVFAYIAGAYLLMKATGFTSSLKSIKGKLFAILVPLIILVSSYFFFLHGYVFDWTNPLKIFLDFGYPFGQAIYVSIALLAILTSRDFLGGVVKKPIIFLTIALMVQYFCDFTFLYQSNAGTWYVGGINDYMYFASYFIMTLAIIYIGSVSQKIRSENSSVTAIKPESGSMTDYDKLLNQILTEIIKRQVRVAGQLAWQEVKKVSGIVVTSEQEVIVSINGDAKKIIDQLLGNYRNLFGDIAVEVSKNAVYYLVAELPTNQVPDSLK